MYVNLVFFFCFQRVHPLGGGSRRRVLGSGGRFRHRHRGRCRRPWYRATAKVIRRNDPYPHFRRSVGSIRSHRRHLSLHETVNLLSTLRLPSPVLRVSMPPDLSAQCRATGKSSAVAYPRRAPEHLHLV